MTARIIDGNALSAKLRGELAAKAAELTAQGTQPCLAVILVGGDPASAVYVRNKVAGCEKAGIKSLKFEYPQDASPADVLGISIKTVEVHRARVMEKMAAQSLAELVQNVIAIESGRN